VQYPLPRHIDRRKVITKIDHRKDVDGLHPYNVGKLWLGIYDLEVDLLPCTPKGILKLLDRYEIELEGKLAVIINRSDLIGKPLSKLFLDRNATVVICHSKTLELEKHARAADVLVSAVGRRPSFVVSEAMVKDGAVVVDVGMSYVGGKLLGDVDFERVKDKASHITPVPGGVGPMTRAMMLQNVLIAAKLQGGRLG
jgi:methylenetetrahydrofolate dehydrogenase (NADP+)/methenyltetrahydrofolate cyclohydrolase